jgi:hypothetical protein
MIASNAEFTLNLYCKRKSRCPRTQSITPSRPFAAKNAGRSKLITTTLWQNYRSRTRIFVYRTSEHTVQVEEGDELCPGGTELSKACIGTVPFSDFRNLNFACDFGSSVLNMPATPPVRRILTHPKQLVTSSAPYVSPESWQTWRWRGRGIASGFDQCGKRLSR